MNGSNWKMCETLMGKCNGASTNNIRCAPRSIETGILSKIPPELLHHILKFLSSEDLVTCSLVCKFLNGVASDESLWRQLYCLRWGLVLPTKKPRECAWKNLYIKRDADDMVEFVRNCPTELKEYYIQMQAAKRCQASLPSQINDDCMILDKTVTDQVSICKKSKGLGDNVVNGHTCSGETCAYHQIGDVFVCEKTGNFHGKLYWILLVVCWCALFRATVLIVCCCHQMKWNQMWTNNKLVRQTKQNRSWARVFLLEPIYWDITAMMRGN